VGVIAWKPFLSEQVEGAVVLIPSVHLTNGIS